ncbi:MAG TPA: RidA family protein [Caulobacter sp.]|nr:RidA family protein [Caulobacter sp.]
MVTFTRFEAAGAPKAQGGYAQALEVADAARWLYISGQVPVGADGAVPVTFEDQARQVWANLEAQLRAAGMGLDNLVKLTVFLSDRSFATANRAVRQEVLGDRQVAMSVIIAGIFDAGWLLEIEAVAAA